MAPAHRRERRRRRRRRQRRAVKLQQPAAPTRGAHDPRPQDDAVFPGGGDDPQRHVQGGQAGPADLPLLDGPHLHVCHGHDGSSRPAQLPAAAPAEGRTARALALRARVPLHALALHRRGAWRQLSQDREGAQGRELDVHVPVFHLRSGVRDGLAQHARRGPVPDNGGHLRGQRAGQAGGEPLGRALDSGHPAGRAAARG
mmetsp:Transcript_103566/g.322710  ORF Transcript_103566/g.322710 Transcript_103566/m.322710 type:complete len:200 (-) Transcript_103566:604-1203(-)